MVHAEFEDHLGGVWCCVCKQQPPQRRARVRTSAVVSSMDVRRLAHSDVGCAGGSVAGHGGCQWRFGAELQEHSLVMVDAGERHWWRFS
jgi:hypothetical protein